MVWVGQVFGKKTGFSVSVITLPQQPTQNKLQLIKQMYMYKLNYTCRLSLWQWNMTLHFCSRSARSAADFGFLFRAKCFTGSGCWPAIDCIALRLRYGHSSGNIPVSCDFFTAQ